MIDLSISCPGNNRSNKTSTKKKKNESRLAVLSRLINSFSYSFKLSFNLQTNKTTRIIIFPYAFPNIKKKKKN